MFLPSAISIGSFPLCGWIIVAGGCAYFEYALSARNDGEVLWRMLIGFIYTFAGLYLLIGPRLESKPLAFLVTGIVFVEGLLEFVIFSRVRPFRGSGWILVDAIATLVVAFLIWHSAPTSPTRSTANLICVKFMISGFTRLIYSLAALKRAKAAA